MQLAELPAKLERVPALCQHIPVGNVEGVVRLKRCQGVHAEVKFVEVYLRHSLRKSRRSRGDNAQGSRSRYKAEIREVCEAALRLVGMESCPEEAETKLIDRARTDGLVVTDDELLSAGCRDAGKTRHAGVQGVQVVRIVEVIIKGPVPGLLVIKIHTLPDLVILYPELLARVREKAGGRIRQWYIGQYPYSGLGKGARWDYAVGENTARGAGRIGIVAGWCGIRFPSGDRLTGGGAQPTG